MPIAATMLATIAEAKRGQHPEQREEGAEADQDAGRQQPFFAQQPAIVDAAPSSNSTRPERQIDQRPDAFRCTASTRWKPAGPISRPVST